MKKLINVPLIVEMAEWHSLTAFLSDSEIKKRLMVATEKEFKQIQQEAMSEEYAQDLRDQEIEKWRAV